MKCCDIWDLVLSFLQMYNIRNCMQINGPTLLEEQQKWEKNQFVSKKKVQLCRMLDEKEKKSGLHNTFNLAVVIETNIPLPQ